ncbi:hypothetical protein [Photobacterium lucens]|uniref:hypothetical protein n=1 Tax=Photobacterium lucens TaxID=2562949 RepID=UPI0013720389|nr:hypothetical protein [Photobacterium lucens]MBP2698599.1 hypothetical protein [Vibrio parahaemolyticus]MZG55872.1 hypothetical protein [Photobacterium lucens]MZG79316.1 hypothetical protein [Photobacterium lucens]
MKSLYLTLFTAALLFGCGGGGGDDGNTNTDTPQQAVPNPDQNVDDQVTGGTGDAGDSTAKFEDLVIPDDFDLSTTYDMPISIDLDTTEPMSLSVYGDFTVADDGSITPIAGSKIISGQIANGDFNGVIAATGTLKNVLIEAWYKDPNKEPFQTVVSVNADGITISN